MKSRVDSLILTATLLCCAFPTLADEASKKAKVEQILQMTHTDLMLRQTMEQVKTMQMEQLKKMPMPEEARAQSEEIQRKTMELVAARLSYDKIKPLYVQLYSDMFTEEEIDGIIGFYQSPAGKAMIEKMPVMMQRMMPMMQKMTADLQTDVQKMVDEYKPKQK